MGIPAEASFVCLNVRDSAYLTHLYKRDTISIFHSYRDCDVQNCVLAAEALADRGYLVIRMGAKVHEAMKTTHPKVIDYAANGMRSDFMDIYLGANCEFCISNGTGFDSVPFIFRRPIVYVNTVPLGYLPTSRKPFLGIANHHFSVQRNRELTFREILAQGIGTCLDSSVFQNKGVALIENTPEEIRDVVIEMAERLEGTWQPHEDDEDLQRRFWEIFPCDAVDDNGVPLHGEIRSRYGAQFLRKNRWWLS